MAASPRSDVVPRALRLSVRTSGFQPEKRGSTPLGPATFPPYAACRRRARSTPNRRTGTMLKTTLRAVAFVVLLTAAACAQQGADAASGASIGPEAPTEVLTIETDNGPVRLNVEIA